MTIRAALLAALGVVGVHAAPAPRAAAGSFTVYEMPTSLAGPCDLATGPDGNMWVQDQLVNKLARIDATTGKVTEFDIPFTVPELNITLPNIGSRTVLACAIQPGADGHLYASNGRRNQLVKVNVTSEEITVLTPKPYDPIGNLQPFNDLDTGKDGMWFTQSTANVISYYEYATGAFKNYPIPVPNGPLGIKVASDGSVWFMGFLAQNIGRLDPRTGTFKFFPVPLDLLGPAVVRAETEGKYLWFTAAVGNSLGRIDITNGDLTAFPDDNLLALPGVNTQDNDGNIWYSSFNVNELNKYDPATNKLSHVVMPNTLIPIPISLPYFLDISIAYCPTNNAIYFTNELIDRVGKYQL